MKNAITDIAGIRVGHADDADAVSGVTCVLVERPNVASAVVGGGAPGTRQVSILAPETINDDVDAIVLSGGSAFGLDAAGGVMAELAGAGVGFPVGSARVPIVSQAIVFDLLNGGIAPVISGPFYWHLGRRACAVALAGDDTVALGSVGGGLGATTANLKGGVGSASVRLASGVTVAALTVVNAVGSVTFGDGPHFRAAPYEVDAEFGGLGLPPQTTETRMPAIKGGAPPSTTISVVATDAILTKAECKRLAIMAHDGLARAVRPAHAPMDGDVVFAVARPSQSFPGIVDFTEFGDAAAACLARAIARAVYEAHTPGGGYQGPPAHRDRFPRQSP